MRVYFVTLGTLVTFGNTDVLESGYGVEPGSGTYFRESPREVLYFIVALIITPPSVPFPILAIS